MARRGACTIAVHFSGRPETSASSEEIVWQLVDALAPCGGIGRVYVVPFGSYQRQIAAVADHDLRVLLYRRLLLAVAEREALRGDRVAELGDVGLGLALLGALAELLADAPGLLGESAIGVGTRRTRQEQRRAEGPRRRIRSENRVF